MMTSCARSRASSSASSRVRYVLAVAALMNSRSAISALDLHASVLHPWTVAGAWTVDALRALLAGAVAVVAVHRRDQ